MFKKIKELWVKVFKKKKRLPKLNNFYKDDKSYDSRGDNPPKRAGKNLQFLGPVLFAMFFGSTVVVVTSILSQAAFVIISNICLSVGFLITISYGIYLKFTNKKKLAAVVELALSLAIITGLFLLALYFTPFVSGWGLAGTLSFLNLIASSINVFTALRILVLPPILDRTQKGLISLGFVKADLSLEFDRNVRPVSENGFRRDNRAKHILAAYPIEVRQGQNYDTSVAIKPYNNAIKRNSDYINKYRASLFGSIIRADDIRDRENSSNSFKNGNTDAMFRFYRTKIRDKIYSTRELAKAKEACKDTKETLRASNQHYAQYFVKRDAKNTKFTKDDYIQSFQEKIESYRLEIIVLLNCMPLYLALQFLIDSADEFTGEEIRDYATEICTEEQVRIYELPPADLDTSQEEKISHGQAPQRINYLFSYSEKYRKHAGCDLENILPVITPG